MKWISVSKNLEENLRSEDLRVDEVIILKMIRLSVDRNNLEAVVNTVMKLRVT
jgi:phosphoribosylformylglycinamidine (FGAM) synthase PurS component